MRRSSAIRHAVAYLLGSAALLIAPSAGAVDATGCAPGSRCLTVQDNGSPGTGATAQCTGRFPDFIVDPEMLENFTGPWFTLAQDFPKTAPANDAPWLAIDFKDGVAGANKYLYVLRDYSFEGMIDAEFNPAKNAVRPWVHMPMMNFDKGRRDPARGVTKERTVIGPELGVKPGKSIRNYAVGFYNAAGGVAIGAVWKTDTPDVTKSRFPKGTMTFKILFSDAKPDDFSGARHPGRRAAVDDQDNRGTDDHPAAADGRVGSRSALADRMGVRHVRLRSRRDRPVALEPAAPGRPLVGQRSWLHAGGSAGRQEAQGDHHLRPDPGLRGRASRLGRPRQRTGR